jgi:hypothetical protein
MFDSELIVACDFSPDVKTDAVFDMTFVAWVFSLGV